MLKRMIKKLISSVFQSMIYDEWADDSDARATMSVANKDTDGSTTNTDAYTTAAISWSAGDMLLIGAHAGATDDVPSSIATTGLTWTKIADVTVLSGSRQLSVWYAIAAADGTSETTTITYPVGQTSCVWSLVAVTGAANVAPLQFDSANVVLQMSVASSLSEFEHPNNVNVTFWGGFTGASEPTPDADFTELGNAHATAGTVDIESQWATNEVDNTTTTATDRSQALISVEVKSAPA